MSDFTCPECNGTGVYQGLNTVEPCRACGGKIGKSVIEYAAECAGIEVPVGDPFPNDIAGLRVASIGTPSPGGTYSINYACQQSIEDVKVHSSYGQTPSVDLTITYTYFPWPIPQCVLNEPAKPFDEIMPAELEGIKEGDSIKVEIHCEDWTRVFHIFDRIIDRPLFGLPSNSFRFVSFSSTPNGEGQKPVVHGTLLYKPLSDADTFTLKNSAGETFWKQKLYTCDPCQDMLFIPILED